jgi:hypothetical protein
MLLETLVSLANTEEGRLRLLSDYRRPLLDLIGLFVQQFERIVERGSEDADSEDEEENSAACNVRKCVGLFYRLYGALHRGGISFALSLKENFNSSRGATKLKAHFRMFLGHPLLRDNEIVEAEDVEAFASLALAARAYMDNTADFADLHAASTLASVLHTGTSSRPDASSSEFTKKLTDSDRAPAVKRQRTSLPEPLSHGKASLQKSPNRVENRDKMDGAEEVAAGKKRRVKAQAALTEPRGGSACLENHTWNLCKCMHAQICRYICKLGRICTLKCTQTRSKKCTRSQQCPENRECACLSMSFFLLSCTRTNVVHMAPSR